MHSISRASFLTYPSSTSRPPHKCHTIFSLAPTTSVHLKSIGMVRKEDLSRPRMSVITHLENLGSSNGRPLPLNDDLDEHKTLEFGNFVARVAILDVELWAAASLRAECHWENLTDKRYNYEKFRIDFTALEFIGLKERSKGKLGETNKCVIAIMKEDRNVKRTLIKSVVGTLDLSIRDLLDGESFPGEERKEYQFPSDENHPEKYVYVSNLCVRLSARRQSIASNMMRFVIESTKLSGIASIYVRVHRNNEPARALYQKLGFQVVEKANSELLENQMYLLCYRP